MKRFLPLLLLCSCATAQSTPVCLPLRHWSVQDQFNMATDIKALPEGSVLVPAFQDYITMRAETRACLGE